MSISHSITFHATCKKVWILIFCFFLERQWSLRNNGTYLIYIVSVTKITYLDQTKFFEKITFYFYQRIHSITVRAFASFVLMDLGSIPRFSRFFVFRSISWTLSDVELSLTTGNISNVVLYWTVLLCFHVHTCITSFRYLSLTCNSFIACYIICDRIFYRIQIWINWSLLFGNILWLFHNNLIFLEN